MRRLAARIAVLVLPAFAVVLLGAPPAGAHAYLVGSNPADGDRVVHAPAELRLHFSEHVVPTATRVVVRTASGSPVRVGHVRLETQDTGDTEEPATIVVTLPTLAEDAYRVSWETLSSDDLHRTSGLIVFGVGRTVAPAGTAATTIRPEEAVLRSALLACMALGMGGLLALRVLRRPPATPVGRVQRVVGLLAGSGAVLAPVLAIALLVGQVRAAAGDPGALLLGGYGVRWSIRFVGLLLLVATWRATSRRRTRTGPAVVVASGLTCLGTALLGHSGAGTDPVRVVAAAAHVAAGLTWAGALVCLVAALLVAPERRRVPELRATLRAFGPPAAGCLSLVMVTGVLLSSDTVISVDAALLTTYGRILLLKVVLVGAAAGLGLHHHLRLRGPHDLDPPRRSVALEAGILVVVVALTGLLASTGTATDPAFGRKAPGSAAAVGRRVGDLQVQAGLSPNRRGDAFAVVDVFDTRRPSPGPVIGVDVRIGDGPVVAAERLTDGHWSVPVTVGAAGPTTLGVTVIRAGLPARTAAFAWTVPGLRANRPVLVSQAPVRTALRLCAAGLGALLLAGWALTVARVRRRRSRPLPEPAAADRLLVRGH